MTATPATTSPLSKPSEEKCRALCEVASVYDANPPVAASEMSQKAGVLATRLNGTASVFLYTLKPLPLPPSTLGSATPSGCCPRSAGLFFTSRSATGMSAALRPTSRYQPLRHVPPVAPTMAFTTGCLLYTSRCV